MYYMKANFPLHYTEAENNVLPWRAQPIMCKPVGCKTAPLCFEWRSVQVVYYYFLVLHKIQTIQLVLSEEDDILSEEHQKWIHGCICYQSRLHSENKHRKRHRCLGSHRGWERHLTITHLVHQKERKISQWRNQDNMTLVERAAENALCSVVEVHLVQATKIHRFICLLYSYLSHSVHLVGCYRFNKAFVTLMYFNALHFGGIHSLFKSRIINSGSPKSSC